MREKLEIIGIGHAVVDIYMHVGEDYPFKDEMDRFKGYRVPNKDDLVGRLMAALPRDGEYAGGSVANTIRSMGALGIKAGFAGKIGQDAMGKFFTQSLFDTGVVPYLAVSCGEPTGCVAVLVHPDQERTMCANTGSSANLHFGDIRQEDVESADILLVEGYGLRNNTEVVTDAAIRACRNGVKLFMTLSDPRCTVKVREAFLHLLGMAGCVIGNAREFAALDVSDESLPQVALKTLGEDGCAVWRGGRWQRYAAGRPARIVNTNGAGDGFAAGFLAGLIRGRSVDDCVRLGNEVAVQVLEREDGYIACSEQFEQPPLLPVL